MALKGVILIAFDNAIFPLSIQRLRRKVIYNTTVVRVASGSEQRVSNWADSLLEFNAALGVKTLVDYRTLDTFFHARFGKLRGFKLRDQAEYQVTTEAFGTGDGVTTAFQLRKTYTQGGNSDVRNIVKPESGTVLVYQNAVQYFETIHFTIDYTTGIITFLAAPANGVSLTWTGNFYVPCRFTDDELDSELFVFRADGTGLVEVPEIGIQGIRDFT